MGAGVFNQSTFTGNYNVYYGNIDQNYPHEDDCLDCGSDQNATSATANPLTLALGNYGGGTQTFLPLPGSQAICAGSSTYASINGGPLTTDQRDFPMPSGCVDAGAVQTNYIQVTNSGDAGVGGSDCDGGTLTCTLRDAIALANTHGGDIDFASGISAISLSPPNGPFALTANGINLIGPSELVQIMTGSQSSLFNISSGATAYLSNFDITDILSSTGSVQGSVIYNDGTLVLNSCVLSNSVVTSQGGSVSGAAIYNDTSGKLTMNQCDLSTNYAYVVQGGNAEGAGLDNLGTATITDSSFIGNDAMNMTGTAKGGGIANSGTLTIDDSTIYANTVASSSQGGGGGISGNATLNNTIVASNSANIGPNPADGSDVNGLVSGSNNLIGDNTGISGILNGVHGNIVGTSITPIDPQLVGLYLTNSTLGIPLPGSPAICAGATSLVPSGVNTDERGFPILASTYCGSGQIDIGAVQTNYSSIAFVQQPTDTAVNTAISPAPSVAVIETNTLTGATDILARIPVPLSYSGGAAELANAGNLTSAGTYSLTPNTIGTGFTLSLGATGTGIPVGSHTFSETSNSFNVGNAAAPTITSPNAIAFLNNASNVFAVTTTGFPTPAISYSSCTNGGFSGNNLTFTDNGNGTATISGMPSGGFTCTVTASNGINPAATQFFTLGVEAALLSAEMYTTPPSLQVGVSVTAFQPVLGHNGEAPYTYTMSPSTPLPAGLSMSTDGFITGTPTVVSASSSYTEVVTDSFNAQAQANFSLAVNGANYVVNTTADSQYSAGTASNCTPNAAANSAAGICALRDVLEAAHEADGGNITFSTAVFPTNAQTSINVSAANGNLSINSNNTVTGGPINITGPGANRLTINGGGPGSDFQVFSVNSGLTVTISGLTISNGNVSSDGAGILNSGTLTLQGVAVSGNTAVTDSGGILNNPGAALTLVDSTISGNHAATDAGINNLRGTMTIIDSTVSGNIASGSATPPAIGGGIGTSGQLTMYGSTVSGNSANWTGSAGNPALGGGIAVTGGGSLTMANSIVEGNMVSGDSPQYPDLYVNGGSYTNAGGNIANTSSTATPTAPGLSALQYNGTNSTVMTMIPMPASAALCAGIVAQVPSGTTTDERGFQLTTPGYCTSGQLDAGAVQTNYTALAFVQQATPVNVSAAMTPSPTVEVMETNSLLSTTDAVMLTNYSPALALTDTGSYLESGSTQSLTSGLAALNGLTFNAADPTDKLTATLDIISGTNSPLAMLSATSNAFAVNSVSTTTVGADASATYSLSSQRVMLSATVTSGSGSVNAGTVTFTVLNGASPVGTPVTSGTVANGAASAIYSVPAGSAAGPYTIQAMYNGTASLNTSGNRTHSLTIGQALASIQLSNLSQTYTGSPLPITAMTTPSGLSVSITYNGSTTVPTNAATYSISATITNANYSGSTNGSFTINQATATVTSVGSANIVYGASTSLAAHISYAGNAAPTGAVTFAINGTNYAGSCTAAAMVRSCTANANTATLAVTTYPITVSEAADTNYPLVSGGNATLTISKATPAISLMPNVSAVLLQNPVTLTATVSSSVSTPSGSVTFLDGSTPLGTVSLMPAISGSSGTPPNTGVAMLTTSSLIATTHSITAVYSGDTNFLGVTSATSSVPVEDFSVTFPSDTTLTIMPGGSVSYSFTLSPVGAATSSRPPSI